MGLLSRLGLRLAHRWVAGENLVDAVKQVRVLNMKGQGAILNIMGENLTAVNIVKQHVAQYLELINTITQERLDACVSLKLTQLGLDLSKGLLISNLQEVLRFASEKDIFVWFDMESSAYTDTTIETYLEFLQRFKGLGLAIQAHLKRTDVDLKRILDSGGIVRLVKGAYDEPQDIAYKSRDEVQERYSQLMRVLFENGTHFAVATHDDKLCQEAIELSVKYGRRPEFQFLMGIGNSLKESLVKEEYRVLDYVPYGRNWLPYTYRRFREKPSNVFLLFRSIIEV